MAIDVGDVVLFTLSGVAIVISIIALIYSRAAYRKEYRSREIEIACNEISVTGSIILRSEKYERAVTLNLVNNTGIPQIVNTISLRVLGYPKFSREQIQKERETYLKFLNQMDDQQKRSIIAVGKYIQSRYTERSPNIGTLSVLGMRRQVHKKCSELFPDLSEDEIAKTKEIWENPSKYLSEIGMKLTDEKLKRMWQKELRVTPNFGEEAFSHQLIGRLKFAVEKEYNLGIIPLYQMVALEIPPKNIQKYDIRIPMDFINVIFNSKVHYGKTVSLRCAFIAQIERTQKFMESKPFELFLEPPNELGRNS